MALKVAISGIVGVFIGLAILCLSLILIQKIVAYFMELKNKPKKSSTQDVVIENKQPKTKEKISGEVVAALAASIFLDLRSFDEQKKLLTIQKVTKPYAPWVNSGKAMLIADHNALLNNRR